MPKKKQTTEISGVASTNSESSHFPNKERMKKIRADTENARNLESLSNANLFDWPSKEIVSRRTSELSDQQSDCDSVQKINEYFPYNRLEEVSRVSRKQVFFDDLLLNFPNAGLAGESQMSAMSENLFSADNQKNRLKRKLMMGNETLDILEISPNDGVISPSKKQKKFLTSSDSSFDTLINCLSSTLERDEIIRDLEITPIKNGVEDVSFIYNVTTFGNMFQKSFPDVNVSTVFGDSDDENSHESDTLFISPVTSTTFMNSSDKGELENLTTNLMQGIDLHLELQNYLKAFDGVNVARKRTKNTLQSSFPDDLQSNIDLQSQVKGLSKIRENKSAVSFASATSFCSDDEDLDKSDLIRMSEESSDWQVHDGPLFVGPPTNDPPTIEPLTEVEKTQLANRSNREVMSETSLGRPFEKFSVDFQSKEADVWVPHLSSEVNYEKIAPFGANSTVSSCELSNNNTVLNETSKCSLPAEPLSEKPYKDVSDIMNHSQAVTFDVSEDSSTNLQGEFTSNSLEESIQEEEEEEEEESQSSITEERRSKWSPTLQDLIEIYNSVLKQNKKIKRNTNLSVSNCFSSHLFSFLNEKLKEKQFKANLIKLSKDFSVSCKPPKEWKVLKPKDDSVSVKEYVAMFQEILQSSLSIGQITRLNNIISGLQEYSEKNYNIFKELKESASTGAGTDVLFTEESERTMAEEEMEPQATPLLKPLNKLPRMSKRRPRFQNKSGKTQSKRKVEAPPPGKMKKIELPSPTELELMLKSCFNSKGLVYTSPKLMDMKNKILATVKLNGNQVLVSGLSYFNSESALASQKTTKKETSQLIIENVTKDQLKDAWYRKTRSIKLKELSRSRALDNPKKVYKKPKKIAAKVKSFRPKTSGSLKTSIKSKKKSENSGTKNVFREENETPRMFVEFEYDQMRLRAQHPIEAIVESSESKDSNLLEKTEEEGLKSEPKIILEDISANSTEAEDFLNKTSENQVFSKDLIFDFDWGENKIGRKIGRTKSFVLRRQPEKRSLASRSKKSHADKARSMVELKNLSKNKHRSRHPNVFFCCNLETVQDKATKKKSQIVKVKKLGSLSSVGPKASHSCKAEAQKKNQQDSSPKRKASGSNAASHSGTKPAESDLEELAKKLSSKEVLHIDSQAVPDCCSIELSFSKSSPDNPAVGVDPNDGVNTSPVEQNSNASADEEEPSSVTQSESAADSAEDTPIVLFPYKSNADTLSFPSMVVHSDSFLKTISQLAVTKSKLNSIFRSNSDLKFCPRRLNENDSETKPFVTFVLTPKQKETAGVSLNKIQVVEKAFFVKTEELGGIEAQKTKEALTDDINGKIPLESIEEFINELSKTLKRADKSKQIKKIQNPQKRTPLIGKQSYPKFCPKRKETFPRTGPDATFFSDKNSVQESLMRKKLSTKGKSVKTEEKLDSEQVKKVRSLGERERPKPTRSFTISPSNNPPKTQINSQKDKKKEETKNKTVKIETKKNNQKSEQPKKVIELKELKGEQVNVMDPKDVPPELVEALKEVIAQAKGITNKNEIIAAIENEFELKQLKPSRAKETLESAPKSPKDLKTFKIKIHCNEHRCSKGAREEKEVVAEPSSEKPHPSEDEPSQAVPVSPQKIKEIELLDSLVSRESDEEKTLEIKKSTYFDAVEKTQKDEEEELHDAPKPNQGLEEGAVDASEAVEEEEKKEKTSHPLLTPSDDRFFSAERLTEESEEIILEKISRALKENKISYSMALLDSFLKKTEESKDEKSSCQQLKKLLRLVEAKSRNLMMSLERNAWLKVLYLLEEVSQAFESQEIEQSFKAQLEANEFWNKIQKLNISRLVDLQNFCATLTQTSTPKRSFHHFGSVFGKIAESLRLIKQKFVSKQNVAAEMNCDVEVHETDSGFGVHSTISLPEISESCAAKANKLKEMNQVEYLKKKIQQQKTCIEQLIEADNEPRPEDVKDQVAEKVLAFYNLGKSEASWHRATSLLNLTSACKKDEAGGSTESGVSREDRLIRSPGYLDLMQCLMKAWDTRMPLSSFSGEI